MTAVCIDMNARGAWEVVMPDRSDAVVCPTLEDARRIGQGWARRRYPCELIVRDAYHRVVVCELVDEHEG